MLSRKQGSQKERMAQKIQKSLNSFLHLKLNDSRLKAMSVTRVELEKSYSRAIIYWDAFDKTRYAEMERAVEKAKGRLRTFLSRTLGKRTVPELVIKRDTQFFDEQRISQLLSSSPSDEP